MEARIDRGRTRRALAGTVIGTAVLATTLAAPTMAQDTPQVELIGRAVLPAATFSEGPTSGTAIGEGPINGQEVPFVDKQPVQGVSALLDNGDGTWLAMSDNGFGAQENSPDYHLRLYTITPEMKTAEGGAGSITVGDFIELRDSGAHITFPLVNGDTDERILTGADFDIESVQRDAEGNLWIGDEFGPFLLKFSPDGVLQQEPVPLPDFQREGELPLLRAPQNPLSSVATSGGFEGMAISPDLSTLYPLLEKPIAGAPEGQLLIHAFDIASNAYTGDWWTYPMDPKGAAIGDFILFNDTQGLIIERDGTQGDLAGHKKIYQVTFGEPGTDVEKELVVDLMRIADPSGISASDRPGDVGVGEQFAFPFVTIESVVVADPSTLVVANDNNYPFSVGRNAAAAEGTALPDDNEFIILKLDRELAVQ